MREKRVAIKDQFLRNSVGIVVGLFCVVAMIIVPNFFSETNIRNILSQATELFLAACGMTFVVLNGGVDFSTTGVIALTSVIGASIMSSDEKMGLMGGSLWSIPVAILVMLLIGCLTGVFNGAMVVSFRMPSFIVTMATQIILGGIALWYTNGLTIGFLPRAFTNFASKTMFNVVPYCLLIVIVLAICGQYVLSKTRFGREVFAIGINQRTSRLSGVPIKRNLVIMFTISGFCAALSGIVVTARMASASASYGSGMFLDIMSCIIIGGTNPAGGAGSVIGTLIGALFIVILRTSLNLMGVNYYLISVIKGLVIIAVALMSKVQSKS